MSTTAPAEPSLGLLLRSLYDPVIARLVDDPAAHAALVYDECRRIVLDEGHAHPEFGLAFMHRYLPHHCWRNGRPVPPAAWHPEFFRDVFGLLGTGAREVREAFRGSAKSTVGSLAVPLAALALELKRYVWIVSDTADQAEQLLGILVNELETNELLLADFPQLRPRMVRGRPEADRDNDVIFENGARIQAVGARMKLRGRRHRQQRPDLAIVDDLENDESVLTKYQRDKLDRWLSRSMLGALAQDADVFVFGTPLHHDAVLRRLPRRARWNGKRYPALRAAGDYTTSTWPAYWTEQALREARDQVTSRDFAQEYLLVVAETEDKPFPREFFQHGTIDHTGKDVRVRIGVDPAVGEKERNDYTAIVVVAKRRGDRRRYVLQALRFRGRSKRIRAHCRSLHDTYGGIVVAESVAFSEWLSQELEDEGIPCKPSKVGRKDKLTRAEAASAHYEHRRYWHADHLRDGEFEDELDAFPDGEHNDYVDALVHADKDLEVEKGAGGSHAVVEHHQAQREQEEEFYDPRYA